MSDKSPLFVSSLELIAHATELFAEKNPKKYKFVILHLANAVELILKDCVIDQGMSIYDNKPGITINIWESISKLKDKGIDIAERPVIELLIDDRNTIQHRFGHPSAESTYYYIEQVVNFFQRFLHHQYHIHLSEALKSHLSDENLKLLGLVRDDFSYLDQLASISIESAVLKGANIVLSEVSKYHQSFFRTTFPNDYRPRVGLFWRKKFNNALFYDLKQKRYLHRDITEDFAYLQNARNYAAHNPEYSTDEINWQKAFDIAKELLAVLREAAKAGYNFKPDEDLISELMKHFAQRTEVDKVIEKFLAENSPKPENSDSETETILSTSSDEIQHTLRKDETE